MTSESGTKSSYKEKVGVYPGGVYILGGDSKS